MFSREQLDALMADTTAPAISIFLPTHVAGREISQDSVRLRNQLDEARRQLVEGGMRGPDADTLLKPGYDLVHDGAYWRHQQEGLAVFLSPGRHHVFKLPVGVPEQMFIDDRFHVRPLLPAVSEGGRFVVLAISLKQAAVYEGGKSGLREIPPEDLPRNMDNLFNGGPNIQGEAEGRDDGTVRKPVTANAADAPAYAEAGSQKLVTNDEVMQYLKQLSGCMEQYLGGTHTPLVLVADERVSGHFKTVCKYRHLVEPAITQPPEALSRDELHRRSLELVKPRFEQGLRNAADRFRMLNGDNNAKGVADPAQVVTAAAQGRVDTLFVRAGAQCWGRWLADAQRAVMHHDRKEGDRELIDYAAGHVVAKDGTVYELPEDQMPANSPVAAILRF